MAPTPEEVAEKAKYEKLVDDAQDAMHKLWKNGGKDRELSATLHAGLQAAWQNDSGSSKGKHNIENAIKGIGAYNGDPTIISAILAVFDSDHAKLAKYTHGFAQPSVAAKNVHDSIGPTFKEIPGAIAGSIPGLSEIGGFFSALGQKATWLRIGEGLLGLILIAIGINAVTKGTAVGDALSKAKTAGKMAVTKGAA